MIGGLGIQVLGATEVAQKLSGLPQKLDLAERRAVQRGALKAESVWKRKASGDVLHVRTGAYRVAINAGPVESDAGRIQARVGSRRGPASKYAPVHEFGAVIVPKTKPYLVFKTRDGAWVSTKRVVIPARRPMGQTLDEVRPIVAEDFRKEVERVTRDAG